MRPAGFVLPIALCLVLSPVGTIASAMPTLAELEARIDGSSQIQLVQSDYELARRRLELERRSHGASLYSQAMASENDDVIDVNRTHSYTALGAGIGVKVPVLGSRLQWQESVSRSELDVARQESLRELQRREILRDLRKAYAEYWAAQRLASLSREILETEPLVESQLTRRTRSGLLLDSDRLELMSGFALARRDTAVAEADQQRALMTMRTLVSGPLEGGLAARPQMTPGCARTDEMIPSWVDAHPEVSFLREAAARAQFSPRDSALYGVSSDIRVGYLTATEWPNAQRGGSAAVTWSFEVPIEMLSHRGLAQATAQAERIRAQRAYEDRRQQIMQDVRNLMSQRAVLEESLRLAQVRFAAGNEAVREKELRSAKWAGDVIEQLQQVRLTRYGSAKALVEAELALARWNADWQMVSASTCRPRGLYAWSSDSVLANLTIHATRPVPSPDGAEGITRLLLSFSAPELKRYQQDAAPLRAALDSAHERGLVVELLLGEPSWLLPAHRDELLTIVQDLRALPFDGLHLDIEPDQLASTGESPDSLLMGLIETAQAVRRVSPWRVEISLHPRYLDAQLGSTTLGGALSDADIAVTLMTYVANPERVIQIARPLLERYPRLTVHVALSLESSLGAEESLYTYSAEERARRISAIEAGLQTPNFAGLTFQPNAPDASRDVVRKE
jgi:outer membrane protein TolC